MNLCVSGGNSPYLTRSEAAQVLRVSVTTLDRWTKAGCIPSIKLGRLVRFEKDALIKLPQQKTA